MNLLDRFDSFLFDFDGVVLDSMKAHASSWIAALKEFGVHVKEFDILKREGMSSFDSIVEIYKELGVEKPDEETIKKINELKRSYFEQYRTEIYPEIPDIFKIIKSNNKKIAIVTGSQRSSIEKRLPCDLTVYVDSFVCTEDVKNGKPNPEPYLRAIELTCSDKDKCCAIENAPMGIQSAKNAGVYCIAVETSLPGKYLIQSDIICRNHRELLSLITGRITKV